MAWLYVPGLEASSLDSSSSSETPTDVSAMSSGKVSPRPPSWSGWKTRPWIERLSGTTSAPSLATSTAARWISSLEGSRASHSAALADAAELMTPAGCGQRSPEPFATYDRASSSWRMCEESSPRRRTSPRSNTSSKTWPTSGSMRNGNCYKRPKSEPPTSVSGGGLLPVWPTPVAHDDNKSVDAYLAMKKRYGRKTITSLQVAVQMWPTPRASEKENSSTVTCPSHGTRHGRLLGPEAVRVTSALWPTPEASDGSGNRISLELGGKRPSGAKRAITLATRSAHHSILYIESSGQQEDSESSRPSQTTSKDGPSGLSKLALYPPFAETLMGWPIGWTDCESSATASYRSWLRTHSAVLRGDYSMIETPLDPACT